MATIMIALTIFNLYRLLSPQAAGTRLGSQGSNVSLRFFGCMQAEFVISACDGFSSSNPAILCLDYDWRPLVH
jgi:hypothetical protein